MGGQLQGEGEAGEFAASCDGIKFSQTCIVQYLYCTPVLPQNADKQAHKDGICASLKLCQATNRVTESAV